MQEYIGLCVGSAVCARVCVCVRVLYAVYPSVGTLVGWDNRLTEKSVANWKKHTVIDIRNMYLDPSLHYQEDFLCLIFLDLNVLLHNLCDYNAQSPVSDKSNN